MAEFKLTDLISVEVLQQIQDGFSKFTGMAALTTDADGVPVTVGSGFTDFCTNLTRKSQIGYQRCQACDRDGALQTLQNGKPSVYSCHAGLVDFAAPIMVEGKFFGSFIGGQVRTEPLDEQEMRKKAVEMDIDPDRYIEAAQKTVRLERDEVERAAEFLSEIAKILSEMAYRNYSALQHSRKLEKASRSQSAFIMSLSLNMQKNMKEWITATEQALTCQDHGDMKQTIRELLAKGMDVYSTMTDAAEYMRMAGDEVELLETEYSVSKLLGQIIDALQKTVDTQNITFSVKIDENVPKYLLGDFGRIGQIINKLLHTLLSYMEQGKIMIGVSARSVQYATLLMIQIKDLDGVIPEEKLERMKAYLVNENMQMEHTEEATELGLSIVGMLIKQLSGTMQIEEHEGEGATFKISLPQLEVRGESTYV